MSVWVSYFDSSYFMSVRITYKDIFLLIKKKKKKSNMIEIFLFCVLLYNLCFWNLATLAF